MKTLSRGIISRTDWKHMWIRSSKGGEVPAPLIDGFKRGDPVEFRTNGPKTRIIDVFHKGMRIVHLNHRPAAIMLNYEGEQYVAENLPDWYESWTPPIWEFRNFV